MRYKLYQVNKWIDFNVLLPRYAHLMVRDRVGMERLERTQILKTRKLLGQYSDWLLRIK